MSNTALKDEIVSVNMATWKNRHYSHFKNGFVQTLGCGDKLVRLRKTSPKNRRYPYNGYVVVGPFEEELGYILWDEDGYTSGFQVNEIALKRAKIKLEKVYTKIDKEMRDWEAENLDYMYEHLAKMCGCRPDEIHHEKIAPWYNFNDNCAIIFRGPKVEGAGSFLGAVQWDAEGNFYDFKPQDKNIMEIRKYYQARDKALMERARNKSVNRTVQQKQEREISLGKELAGFIIRHAKHIAVGVALFVALSAGINEFKTTILNPDYENTAYEAGYHAVSMETHRTQDNQGYWYDYWDIARSYDDSYDFDSWVYGTYNNVGWNTSSKLDCMDELFSKLCASGVTEYHSFLEYCESKGVCVEKNGKLVVDTSEYRKLVEDYMRSINEDTVEQTAAKESGFRI